MLPSKAKLRRAEKRRDNISLADMRDENALIFLELWTWLGNSKDSSILAPLTDEQLRRCNVIIVFNSKFVNINLGELMHWRKGSSIGGKIDPEQMQKRLYKTIINLATAGEIVEDAVAGDTTPDIIDKHILKVSELSINTDANAEDERPPTVVLDQVGEDNEFNPEDIDRMEDEGEAFIEDDLEDEDDFEIIKRGDDEDDVTTTDDVTTVDNGIEKACAKFIEAGTLSTKEYQRVIAASDAYKSIANPYGDGTLADMMDVPVEDVNIAPEVLFDDITMLDKNMAVTASKKFTKQYIEKVLPKDIISSVVSVQRAGVLVKDYRAEAIVDAANGLILHTVSLEPVKGSSTPVRFTTPMLDDEGYWTANDIRCTMRKQRVDVPIRKTSPSTVALTTFYGKNFVRRSTRATADRTKWLTDNISAIWLDKDNTTVTDLKFANVFDPSITLPKDYTSIAMRLRGFNAGGFVYDFNVKDMSNIYGEDTVQSLSKQGLVPIGKSRTAVLAMDAASIIYKVTDKATTDLGRITEVLGLSTEKAPNEYTELSMMGKAIPLAVIMGYYLGLENLLKEYAVDYKVVESGERVVKGDGDLVLALKGSKVVITFDNAEQELLFYGLKPYLTIMKDFTLKDFNQKDVYLNLIQKDGLTVRYLNELDLMETMFVDPISERILKKMGEPTHFKGLLKRGNELVVTDQHAEETDMDEMHIYGYQRIAGAVYTGLVRGIRDSNNKPGSKRKIDIPSNAIWSAISSDPSTMPAGDANPIQSIKEADVVTFGGTGGRSGRSMVKRTRQLRKSDLGIISGDTVDSGDVGTTSYMSSNPLLSDVDGMPGKDDRDNLSISQYISGPVALAPGTFFDDDKRANFVGIQHGSGMSADGYEAPSFRTGYEKVVAHRTSSSQASVADESGRVISVDEYGVIVEYDTKPKTTKAYTIGKTFGRHEGSVFPHELVSNVVKGQKFSKGAVLVYNKKFFAPDIFNPEQVNWLLGSYANVVLLEGIDTLEDSSAISEGLSEKLRTQITKVKNVTVRFDQAIHDLSNLGDTLQPDSNLCIIEDGLTATNDAFNEDSLDTLSRITSQTPKSGVQGRIEKMEIFYNGDEEDMSESVAALVKKSDRRRKKEAKYSHKTIADNGRVDSTLRIDGNPVELDTIVVRFYITQVVNAVGGDKAVFANQMKTTFRRVMTGENVTDDGMELDAIFGKKSIDDRIVLSVYQIGTTAMICQLMHEKCLEILNT